MHRVSYTGSGRVAVEPAGEPPSPGPREVIVEVAFTGICGTDLHIAAGDMEQRVAPGTVLGHEMSGRIAAVGGEVTGWRAGDAVTVLPLDWCGQCPACLRGHGHVCQRLAFLGIDAPGAMQRWWTVHERTLVRLPATLPLRDATLVEPAAVAAHDVRRARVGLGDQVLVVGGGPVGILVAVTARHAGADVVLAEPDAYRREVAAGLGFPALDPREASVAEVMSERTGGAGADACFEVSGSAAGLADAVASLAVRGRLALVGIHAGRRELDMHRIFWRELELLGARLYQRRDFESAAALLERRVIPADNLVSHVRPITQAPEAFRALEDKDHVMKILIDCAV